MKTKAIILILLLTLALSACAAPPDAPAAAPPPEESAYTLTVSGDGIDGQLTFTLEQLQALADAEFSHVYSAINNWPSSRFYAARGVKISAILAAAGVLDSAQTIVFRSADGYEATLTRSQLLDTPQYYYPAPGESDQGAEQVYPILAYSYKEGSSDMADIVPDRPCLVLGQTNYLEHNNPAFVVGVDSITVSAAPAQAWPAASTFPLPGPIAAGELVKLQHESFGLVKLHYTLDGSEPTVESAMYNPSTYQPELNVPIKIEQDTQIKVLVTGYGKEPSEIAIFDFTVSN